MTLNGKFLISVKYVIPIVIAAFTVGSFYYKAAATADNLEENINATKNNTLNLAQNEVILNNIQILMQRYADRQEDILDILNSLNGSEERQNYIIERLTSHHEVFRTPLTNP